MKARFPQTNGGAEPEENKTTAICCPKNNRCIGPPEPVSARLKKRQARFNRVALTKSNALHSRTPPVSENDVWRFVWNKRMKQKSRQDPAKRKQTCLLSWPPEGQRNPFPDNFADLSGLYNFCYRHKNPPKEWWRTYCKTFRVRISGRILAR